MPKLPSKWHCSGNYDDNNSSFDQWDNTSNYKHDISWRNNGDHVLQLAVMMSFVSRIIRKCMGQWQCSWGQIRISDKTKQANNRLSRSHCCRGGFLMATRAIFWRKFLWMFRLKLLSYSLSFPYVLGSQWRLGASSRSRALLNRGGKRGGLKPIGERCNLSPLTSAEGVYSAASQITRTSHSIALSGWLVFRPLNPVQLNLLLLLRRECYSSFVTGCSVIWRFSLRLSLSLPNSYPPSLFIVFLFSYVESL